MSIKGVVNIRYAGSLIATLVAVLAALLSLLAIATYQTDSSSAQVAPEQATAMSADGNPGPELPGMRGYPPVEQLDGPIRIGVQPGHWRIDELPDELARLRTSTGAVYGSLRELDINLAVSVRLVDRLMRSGFQAELVPAAIPAGYRADVFISVHADRADQPDRRGWKLSAPWRPSPASTRLAEDFSRAFRESGLPEDRGGVTANMRGYFGFSWWRYQQVISPYTPAVLVEMGFMGNASDRARMRDDPDFYAGILFKAVQYYLETLDRADVGMLVPLLHQTRLAGEGGVVARSAPSFNAGIVERYEPGHRLTPVDTAGDGWYEVFSRMRWQGVWIHESELE
jgi:N-acetylmuramoyl-L-alanine amidase